LEEKRNIIKQVIGIILSILFCNIYLFKRQLTNILLTRILLTMLLPQKAGLQNYLFNMSFLKLCIFH